MNYTLTHTEIRIATEEITCDAMRSYVDMNYALRMKGMETTLKHKNDIVAIVRNKSAKIKPGQEYIYREFVDEGGQIYFMCSVIEMDQVAKRNKLYPKLILNQL